MTLRNRKFLRKFLADSNMPQRRSIADDLALRATLVGRVSPPARHKESSPPVIVSLTPGFEEPTDPSASREPPAAPPQDAPRDVQDTEQPVSRNETEEGTKKVPLALRRLAAYNRFTVSDAC